MHHERAVGRRARHPRKQHLLTGAEQQLRNGDREHRPRDPPRGRAREARARARRGEQRLVEALEAAALLAVALLEAQRAGSLEHFECGEVKWKVALWAREADFANSAVGLRLK